MLLLSNEKKCSDGLARALSVCFVALDQNGSAISGIKNFDTQTGVAKSLDDTDVVPATWEFRVKARPNESVGQRVVTTKRLIVEAGHDFADHVVAAADQNVFSCSFCQPRPLRLAYQELMRRESRYSLIRSGEEQAIVIEMYRAERALGRLDEPLIPYLDRLNVESGQVSTYMSCDGNRRGLHGGYIDFRTSISTEAVLRLFAELRYDRSIESGIEFGLRFLGTGTESFFLCYTLQVRDRGWENFEPVLSRFCARC